MSVNLEPCAGLFDGLRPVAKLKVSDWADANRYLTSESSAQPGPWNTSKTPYLREPMDSLSPTSQIVNVDVIKGVQLGFTESALNAVGCYMDLDPCPIMYVMPTLDMSKGISESRVDPMIQYSPSLSTKIKTGRSRDSGNTKHVKKFAGGLLVLSGANSAASLRSRSVKVLVLDEVDAYPLNVDDEGSPISLAEKRTVTYGSKRKIYKLSTPANQATSVIEREFFTTDQRKYMVPCPECFAIQDLIFERLRWTKGDFDSAKYYCIHCDYAIEERFKTWMLSEDNGAGWVMTKPENESSTRRGYHINSLYSPLGWLSWSDIAKQWEDAQTDVNKLKVFTNTILGETWKDTGEAPESDNLYNRRETYNLNKPPKDVIFITVGVDVQKDRLELEIVGWCANKRTYSIDYRVYLGDPSQVGVWNDLAKVVTESFVREDGVELPMRLMAVDTGWNTNMVYTFCRRFDATRVIPVKGYDNQPSIISPPRQVDVATKGKKIGKMKIWPVGVSMIKSELYGWLNQEKEEDGSAPAGYCHFPQYDLHYFKMITAEVLQKTEDKGNFPKYKWVKKYERNEALDCRVYARAAANVVGIDRMSQEQLEAMAMTYAPTESKPVAKKKRERSDFWRN